MLIESSADAVQATASDLIKMLHQEAAAEDFADQLARIELLPENSAAKPALVELVRMSMALRNRLDLSQQRESGMMAVIETARDLSSRLHLKELLRAIVSRARNMLGSQVAWLSTYDTGLEAFHVLAADGAQVRTTGEMVASRGLGIVSVVLRTRLPFTTSDYLSDKRFAHDMALDSTFREEGIAAVVGVPMLWEDEVIGLLFVADRYHRTHTAQNISVLSTLATHAAVAIKNALAFEQVGAALASAEDARSELERHTAKVQAAAEAHEQMTSLLAQGASLGKLCESIAALMQGEVLVLDDAAQIVGRGSAPGYENSQAGRYEAHGEHSRVLMKALRDSRVIGRSVLAYTTEGESCRVSAVIAGEDVLGAVLLFRRDELDDMTIRTFERSASIVGVVLLSRERMETTRIRDQSALLRALLSLRQDDQAILRERAGRFGLDLSKPCSLMLVDTRVPQTVPELRRLRSSNLLANAVLDEMDGVLTILCPTTQAEDIRRTVSAMANENPGASFLGVLSRPLATPADIPAAHVSLRRALPVLRRIGARECIVSQNELALYSTLFETHDQASLTGFLESTIGPLTAHDLKRGSELATSLLSYFENNQNARASAERLGIHVNTMRQRLASIEALIGYWGNATRALEIHMALRLWRLSRDKDSAE